MKKIQLKNDDFLGYVKHLRHACRGIVVKDGKVLLGYESKNDKYIISGGGVEEGETLSHCCERELLEETGMQVRAKEEYHKTNIADYGLYRREFTALKEFCELQ